MKYNKLNLIIIRFIFFVIFLLSQTIKSDFTYLDELTGKIAKNCKEYGLGEDVKFYLDFFKHGCPPHGGFAIGVDRLTMLLLGIPSVKETEFLFRGPNRLAP